MRTRPHRSYAGNRGCSAAARGRAGPTCQDRRASLQAGGRGRGRRSSVLCCCACKGEQQSCS